tara:strand:- start:921 stop:1193 length:273 start_codon:yes stop_codon:yes gene_type:complete
MAADLFKSKFNTKSAGLYARKPLTKEEVSWADTLIVMEDEQRSEIAKRFPKAYMQKRILSLEIPDIYNYGDPKLAKELKTKLNEYAELLA